MTTYNFFPEGSDTPDPIEPELWKWVAMYNDGTVLYQFNDSDKTFHQFREIDQSKLISFIMTSDNKPSVTLLFLPGMKLIHFYRNVRLNIGQANEVNVRLYCMGYELNGVKVITVIMPDGSIAIVDEVDKIQLR